MSTLQKALLFQRTVVIQHRTPGNNAATEHRVDPYAMRLYKNGLYLVTYSHRAKAYRLFAVERIRRVELTRKISP